MIRRILLLSILTAVVIVSYSLRSDSTAAQKRMVKRSRIQNIDVAYGYHTAAELEYLASIPAESKKSTKTRPQETDNRSSLQNTLTIVLDFKEPGQSTSSDVFGNVVGTFNIGAYGFSPNEYQSVVNAIASEVDQDFFNEITGTVAGQDLEIDFMIGDVGIAPPGLTNFYYIQIGTGISGKHATNLGTFGVAATSSVRNSSGTGPNGVDVGDVVGSIFTDHINLLEGLSPLNALTSGNITFTTFAIAGTTSHEVAHALSLLHIKKAQSVQPTDVPPIMGTGASPYGLPDQDRIGEREFSLSGFDGNNEPLQHIAQLVGAVGLQSPLSLTAEQFFDRTGQPGFESIIFTKALVNSQGGLIVHGFCDSFPGCSRLYSISSDGNLNWQSAEVGGKSVSDPFMLLGPDDRTYFLNSSAIQAVNSSGGAIPGWPVAMPYVFGTSFNSVLVDAGDGTVYARSGLTSGGPPFPVSIIAINSDGSQKWLTDYANENEGGRGLVQAWNGNVWTVIRNVGVVSLNKNTGSEVCVNPSWSHYYGSLIGGAEGLFTSSQSALSSYGSNCNSNDLLSLQNRAIELRAYRSNALLGIDYLTNPFDPAAVRLVAISRLGNLLWRNSEINPVGATASTIRKINHKYLYVLGNHVTDGNRQKLFIVNATTGATSGLIETAPYCTGCGVAVGNDGTIYLYDLSSTRIYKVSGASVGVSVSGRVLNSMGRPIRGAVVSITNTQSMVTRTTTTASYGNYQFPDITPEATYTIGISQRRYVFQPQTLLITDNLTNFDFVGAQNGVLR